MLRTLLTAGLTALAAAVVTDGPLLAQQLASATSGGTIQGSVVTATGGNPLAMAEVAVAGTELAAVTDLNGRYSVVGVPAGTHSLSVRLIGYAVKTVTGVLVRRSRVPSRTARRCLSTCSRFISSRA